MKKIMIMAAVALTVAACGGKKDGSSADAVADNGPVVTRTVGGLEVSWIKDNQGERLMPVSLFPDAPQSLIDSLGVQDGLPSSVGTFLVRTDDGLILFDTGNGGEDAGLYSGLDSLGVAPSDIDYLYITHFHGDHIGGMMAGDSVVFPNAQVYASKVEYDAWTTPGDGHDQAIRTMEAYGDRLHLFNDGDVLPGGFTAIAAYGHTPGHTVFQNGKLLIVGDLMHGAAIQMIRPEVNASFDMDGAAAAATRAKFISYARENGCVMAGMHLPEPGFYDFAAEQAGK